MLKKLKREDLTFDVCTLILGLLVFSIALFPLIYILVASISNPRYVVTGEVMLWPKDITFAAYEAVFANSKILLGYMNTIFYTVLGTLINIALTTMVAYPLSKKDLYGRNIITMFLTFTMFFSGGMIPSYLLIKNLGIYNSFWAMIIPNAISMWNLLVMRNYFQTAIPNELIEASKVDGCTNVGALVRVVLPVAKPIMAVMVIFYAVGHWNAYFDALIYLSNNELFPLQVILREILLQNQISGMGEAVSSTLSSEQYLISESIKYAVIVVASIPVLVLYPFLQKYFVKGVMVGAIKG